MRGRAQRVTRRGRPAVVIVSAAEYERLTRRDRAEAGGFVEHLLAQPKQEAIARKRTVGAPGVRPRDIDFSD